MGKVKHGLCKHPLYRVWKNMRRRCYDKKFTYYHNYGARGIKICEEWYKDFKLFYDWSIANGYEKRLTIDRINNDGDYEPDNCRYTTRKVQANNRRKRKPKTSGAMFFCRQHGIEKYHKMIWRYLKNGKSEEWVLNKYKH